jgi:predicted nucleic acid-binding protein
MTGLIDTNILIDILRGYPRAVKWAQSNPHITLWLPSIVRMEIVAGCNTKQELRDALNLMKPLKLVHITEVDSAWAMEKFELFHLSHKVEIADCFLAAMSIRLQLPVYTRNTKDLLVFKAVQIVNPY